MRDKKRTNRLAEITSMHNVSQRKYNANPEKYEEENSSCNIDDYPATLPYLYEVDYLKAKRVVYNEELAEWLPKLEDAQRYVASLESEIVSMTARIEELEALGEKL